MKAWIGLLARLVVGGVWLVAGAVKIPDPAASIAAVRAYELLPGSLVEPVGYLLPAVEVVIGGALILGVLTRGAALVSGLLLVAFIIGISYAWAQGLSIDCGCFGDGGYDPDAAAKYPWEIARDVGLLVASGYLVWLGRTRFALDSLLFSSTTYDDDHRDDDHDHHLDPSEGTGTDPDASDLIDTGRTP